MKFLGNLSTGFRNHRRISAKITKIGRCSWKKKEKSLFFDKSEGLQHVVLLKFGLFTVSSQGLCAQL